MYADLSSKRVNAKVTIQTYMNNILKRIQIDICSGILKIFIMTFIYDPHKPIGYLISFTGCWILFSKEKNMCSEWYIEYIFFLLNKSASFTAIESVTFIRKSFQEVFHISLQFLCFNRRVTYLPHPLDALTFSPFDDSL